MDRYQKQTVREFIDLHNSRIDKYLREVGLLNPNGTFPSSQGVLKELENWFFDVLNSHNYTFLMSLFSSPEVSIAISGDDSHNGNPVIFEFDASLWPHLLEEAGSHVSLDSP